MDFHWAYAAPKTGNYSWYTTLICNGKMRNRFCPKIKYLQDNENVTSINVNEMEEKRYEKSQNISSFMEKTQQKKINNTKWHFVLWFQYKEILEKLCIPFFEEKQTAMFFFIIIEYLAWNWNQLHVFSYSQFSKAACIGIQ